MKYLTLDKSLKKNMLMLVIISADYKKILLNASQQIFKYNSACVLQNGHGITEWLSLYIFPSKMMR